MDGLSAGVFYKAKVLRKTDIGYMLEIYGNEVFLHKNQSNGELNDNDIVEAFLYYDSQKRLSATLEHATVSLNEPNWVNVVEVLPNVGVFVNIGISKDVLISKDFLPFEQSGWPIIGDRLFVELKDKKNQLVGKVVSRNNLYQYRMNHDDLPMNEEVEAWVARVASEGIIAYTDDLKSIFIHGTQTRDAHRLGEEIYPKIVYQRDKNEYNGSLIDQKENMIDADAEVIIKYLKSHQDEMSFGNNSTPEEVKLVFKMSKKAFKRALGSLYKKRVIDFDGDKVIYKG